MVTTSIRRWIKQSGSQVEHILDDNHIAALDKKYLTVLGKSVGSFGTIALDEIHTAAVNYLRSSINASLAKYEPLVNAVVEKSYGILISAYAKGAHVGELEERLHAIPSLLSHTCDMVLSKIDTSDDPQCLQMMAVVLFAVRPLSMQEICLVVDICDPASIKREITIERQERLESKLLISSRGLLSVQSGLVMFVHASAHEHVKSIFMSRLDNAHPDGDMVLLRACLLYLQQPQKKMKRYFPDTELEHPLNQLGKKMKRYFRDTNPEPSKTGNTVMVLPFFRYAVTYWVLHGTHARRRIDSHLFEREIQSMDGRDFETWKSYFSTLREGSEGDTAQQEVESYFLARVRAVTTPIELMSQINTQAGGHSWVEEAVSPDSTNKSNQKKSKKPNTVHERFVTVEESSTYGLRDLLLASGYQAALFVNPSDSQAAAHGSYLMRQSITTSVNNHGTRPGPSSYHATEPR